MNEIILFNLIMAVKKEIESKIKDLTFLPESAIIPGLDDGKIIGYTRSLELIKTAMSVYHEKENASKLPREQ